MVTISTNWLLATKFKWMAYNCMLCNHYYTNKTKSLLIHTQMHTNNSILQPGAVSCTSSYTVGYDTLHLALCMHQLTCSTLTRPALYISAHAFYNSTCIDISQTFTQDILYTYTLHMCILHLQCYTFTHCSPSSHTSQQLAPSALAPNLEIMRCSLETYMNKFKHISCKVLLKVCL